MGGLVQKLDQGIQATLCELLLKVTQRSREVDSNRQHFPHRKCKHPLKAEYLNRGLGPSFQGQEEM